MYAMVYNLLNMVAEAQRSRRVLIVEDEPLLGNLLKQRLEKEQFSVTLVRDGEEALAVLKTAAPDLILLDIILPKVSGFEVMERLNTDPVFSNMKVPIVIVSNLGQESDVEKGQALGAIGYFVKAQLSIEDLLVKIRDFFSQ